MKIVRILVLLLVVILAACGGGEPVPQDTPAEAPAPTVESMPEAPVETGTMTETEIIDEGAAMTETQVMTEAEMLTDTETMTETAAEPAEMPEETTARPAWQQLPLINARTNESFTLADFPGKTVFVEPMATWCTNCRQQLTNVRAAQDVLADSNVVFVALSVETNLDNTTLAQYAGEAGFDWLFAVMTPELLQELSDLFGRTIANPPATPHFIIRGDGTTTDLSTGIDSVDQIVNQVQAAMQ